MAGSLPFHLGVTDSSTSVSTVVVFLIACLGGALSTLDSPVIVLDCVALASGFSFVSLDGSVTLESSSVFVVCSVVCVVDLGLGGDFTGITGPSDQHL